MLGACASWPSGKMCPVFAGCPRAILQTPITAEHVHGITGLDGAVLPEPTLPLQSQHGVAFLINQLLTAEAPVTLAMLGPLTNLAMALIQSPRKLPRASTGSW